jgi:two-component system sensor histidine kinase UhpB
VLCGGFLWSIFGWVSALSLGDLRLMVLAASITTLITAAETEQGSRARRHLWLRIADFRSLVSRTEDAREAERTALARDVHDNLGQLLTGLKIKLKMISAGNVANREGELSTALTEVDAILAEVERMGNELSPEMSDATEPVSDTLQRLADECSKRFGINISVRTETIDLDPAVAYAVARIVQEALTNIARHAEAGSAVISLHQEPDEVCVAIEDDGKGFALSPAVNSGLGITGMRERAFLLGGTLDIAPGATRGTVVKVRIPVRRELPLKTYSVRTTSSG